MLMASTQKDKIPLDHLLNYPIEWYLDPKNIPNQELVTETIKWFEAGSGTRAFGLLEFLNFFYKQYEFMQEHITDCAWVVRYLTALPVSALQKHILYGFLLKWTGGYPPLCLDEAQQKTLKAIQQLFLDGEPGSPERDFCKADVNQRKRFMGMGIAFSTTINHGVDVREILSEMGLMQKQTTFSSFKELFAEACKQSLTGPFESQAKYFIAESKYEFLFNSWLLDKKCWAQDDESAYRLFLTFTYFEEFLQQVSRAEKSSLIVENIPGKAVSVPMKIFLSYSWDSMEHKGWVLQLADRLLGAGLDVILDQYELRVGKNLTHFMEASVRNADKVICIFTPNYKLKAEGRTGGVGYEYSMINQSLYKQQVENNKLIPVLRSGDADTSVPFFIQSYVWHDMTSDEDFDQSFETLLREIYDEPYLKKPEIGNKPAFGSRPNVKKDTLPKKDLSNLSWSGLTPMFIESFDFKNSVTKVFSNYEEKVWQGRLEAGVFKLLNHKDASAVKYHYLNINNQEMAALITSVEVSMIDAEKENSGCGLLFCYDEAASSYYAFQLNHNGQYRLWLKDANGYKVLVSGRSKLIIPNEFNKLAFVKENGSIYLFINDQFLKKVNDNTLTSGHSGVIAFSTGQFEFDNLAFYQH